MSQIPPIVLKKLGQLRRRERLLRLVWGLACFGSIVVVVFLVACLVDWLYDLWDETPRGLRLFMFRGQLVLAGLIGLLLVLRPQLRRLRREKLALLLEDKLPVFQHRLISALELNRPGARTAGMSPELLAAMTCEAAEQARPRDFRTVADHSRLKRSAFVLAPAILLALSLFLLAPQTAVALIQRQMLWDVDIPRAVSVAAAGPTIWPNGEEVFLKFDVRGPGVTDGRSGSVRVRAEDGSVFSVPLTMDVATGEDSAAYAARVPPASADFTYMAKVGDGRTRSPGRIRYVARPSVVKHDAYVILPDYIGMKPGGRPYEQAQLRGDINGMQGLTARVVIQTQKPIVRAVLQIHGSPCPDLSGPSGLTRSHELQNRMLATLAAGMNQALAMGPLAGACTANASLAPVPLRRFEQTFSTPTDTVQWSFDLKATETSYRVAVFDEYAFGGKTESVRAIKIEPEALPTVVLHPERWEPPPAFKSRNKSPQLIDFEGMPLPIVDDNKPGPLRVSYEAFGPYGIGRAQLKIGVIRGGNDSEGDPSKPKLQRWVTLPLEEIHDTERTFDKSRGAFVDSSDTEAVPFYPLPSPRPSEVWHRMHAGGRLDFQPAGILDEEGQPFAFKQDDQIVVYVEVFNRNPDPEKALMGKSRLREKDLVSWEKFEAWCYDTLQEASRIEALMFMQQRVYDRPWPSIFPDK
jgi:hypothetical protein